MNAGNRYNQPLTQQQFGYLPPLPRKSKREAKEAEEEDAEQGVYTDRSKAPLQTGDRYTRENKVRFPFLVHDMLKTLHREGLHEALCWKEHGRCIVVRNKKLFSEQVLPRFSKMRSYAAFQRQLNTYGYIRVTQGPDADSYYHECFLRGRDDLAFSILPNTAAAGKRASGKPRPAVEPDFYCMPYMPQYSEDDLHHPQPLPPTAAALVQGHGTELPLLETATTTELLLKDSSDDDDIDAPPAIFRRRALSEGVPIFFEHVATSPPMKKQKHDDNDSAGSGGIAVVTPPLRSKERFCTSTNEQVQEKEQEHESLLLCPICEKYDCLLCGVEEEDDCSLEEEDECSLEDEPANDLPELTDEDKCDPLFILPEIWRRQEEEEAAVRRQEVEIAAARFLAEECRQDQHEDGSTDGDEMANGENSDGDSSLSADLDGFASLPDHPFESFLTDYYR